MGGGAVTILAVDPGNTESAYVLIDRNCVPLEFGKLPNDELLDHIAVQWVSNDDKWDIEHIAIEMVASYGMAVGADVFETCVWIGRFQQMVLDRFSASPQLVKRHPVKLHHCHSAMAKDPNITQALVDRFAAGQPNHGKGTKAAPGWFYGFRADIWQAYALAVYAADMFASEEVT
jgi:hypothetical protein